ncbi:MAG: zinc metallopeptidase [Parachlamydiales bacterium]|nr:zinc metallopeptidase [Parachlamydiales bacterium]
MTIQNISYYKPKTKEDIEIRVGQSYFILDIIRNILSIPGKILLLNRNLNSGNVSKEIIDKIRDYLHENGLHDVDVSINEYNPIKIWKRTFSNPKTSILSKCTLGILYAIFETLTIPKLTGMLSDSYNPLTNTVNLISNDLSIALHECGHAKDFNSAKYPTLYALANAIPMIGPATTLYQEYQASANAIEHLRQKGDIEGVKEAWKTLTPAFSTYMAYAGEMCFTISSPLWIYSLMNIGLGHLVGQFMAAKEKTPAPEKPLKEVAIKAPPPAVTAAPTPVPTDKKTLYEFCFV